MACLWCHHGVHVRTCAHSPTLSTLSVSAVLQVCYITTVSPLKGPLFYLRQLLRVLPMREFDDLRLKQEQPAPGDADQSTHHPSYEEAARARGIVVDDNEAALALQEAIDQGETPCVLRRMYVTLIRHQPYTKPMQLLATFMNDLSLDFYRGPVDGLAQPVHPFSGYDPEDITTLAFAENRAPREAQGPNTCYNLLLHAISTMLERQGSCMDDFELPTPLLGGDALPELDQHLQEYCRGMGALRARRMLRERVPNILDVPEQRSFFWDMMRRLRVRKGAQEFDERWEELQGEEDEAHAPQVRSARACVMLAGLHSHSLAAHPL